MFNVVHRINGTSTQLSRTAAEFHCASEGAVRIHLLDLAASAMQKGLGFTYVPGALPSLYVDGGHEYRVHVLSRPQARR